MIGLIALVLSAYSFGQAQPPVKVNVLNVCSPSAEEQQEIAAALAKIPRQPPFSPDFEVSRGRSSLDSGSSLFQAGDGAQLAPDSAIADYVRIRRELSGKATFSTVQYSFSTDPKNMVETLVFQVREPKDLMQVSIEDSASTVTSAAAMLSAGTPASRVKLERFGKASVVLARCNASDAGPPPDQSAYAPLFQSASQIITSYRDILGARALVPQELARIGSSGKAHSAPHPKPAASGH